MSETLTVNQKEAIALTDEILSNLQAINNTLTESGKVRPVFMGHFTDMTADIHGIIDLIKDILKSNDAEFSRNAHDSDLRALVVAKSMTAHAILAQVQSRFSAGSTRYPLQTIKNVLCTYASDDICGFQLSKDEDKPRPCKKPRYAYYLILHKH